MKTASEPIASVPRSSLFTFHFSLFTKSGFTLLEVLIAFAITCIVIAALYSTFFVSARAVGAVDESLVRLQEARAVMDVLKRELESSCYETRKDYTVFKLNDRDFYGKQASQLTFTSTSPAIPGLAKINYTVEESGKKLVLRKAMTSAFAKSGEIKPFELMEDIGSFTVEAKFNDKWVKTWDSTLAGSTPEQVRISMSLSIKKGEAPVTISDVAKPRIGKAL